MDISYFPSSLHYIAKGILKPPQDVNSQLAGRVGTKILGLKIGMWRGVTLFSTFTLEPKKVKKDNDFLENKKYSYLKIWKKDAPFADQVLGLNIQYVFFG